MTIRDKIIAVLKRKIRPNCSDDRCMCMGDDVRWDCILDITPDKLADAILADVGEQSLKEHEG